MINLGPIQFQLLEPALINSLCFTFIFSVLAYLIVEVFKVNEPKVKSMIYLIPLLTPLIILLLLPPSLTSHYVQTIGSTQVHSNLLKTTVVEGETLSVFGLVSLIGLVASISYLSGMFTLGDRIVSRLYGVVELSADENEKLFSTVKRLSKNLQMVAPRIGLIENLKPNAFTAGYGAKAIVVVSVGLLETLERSELNAVLAHELAHIKNRDFNFKALTSALKLTSFFNPLVYLLSSAISRQREILADKVGMKLLKKPELLGKTLIKIWEASKNFPQDGFVKQLASGLFITSPVRRVANAFSSHPQMDFRLSNIAERGVSKGMDRRGMLKVFAACAFIALSGIFAYRSMTPTSIVISTEEGGTFAFAVPPILFPIMEPLMGGGVGLMTYRTAPFIASSSAVERFGEFTTVFIHGSLLGGSNMYFIALALINIMVAAIIVTITFWRNRDIILGDKALMTSKAKEAFT